MKNYFITIFGAAPIFMIFILVGCAYFERTLLFKDLPTSLYGLFGLYHCDNLNEITSIVVNIAGFISFFYIIGYIFLFAMAIMNF